ncbi:MAG: Holliday junction resolvase RuvX [Pirellulales bacterium]|nr:Holliday junction resolvase RuvX [Pirellulales bacterium]
MTPSERSSNRPGRVAGIDYGTVRIGIALSDPGRTIASPHENYTRRGKDQDARRFRRLVEEEAVVLFVVGLPVHTDGHESQKSQEAREFGAWLAETTGTEVVYFDERFSSAEAERFLIDAEMTSKRRRRRLDMVAASIILSAFLESDRRGQNEPGALDD